MIFTVEIKKECFYFKIVGLCDVLQCMMGFFAVYMQKNIFIIEV